MMEIRKLRQIVLHTGITVALLGVGVCLGSVAHGKSLTRVRFVESHRDAILGTLPTYVAEHEHFFRKHGVIVNYVSGAGGGATMRLLSTGNVDMADGGTPAAILAALSDPNIELVGDEYHSASVFVWIAPASVSGVSALSGGKLGYSRPGSSSQFLAKMSVKRAHLKNVQLVSVGGLGANWAAARSGTITAGWAMEPFLSAKIKRDHAHIVLNPGDYIHHFYGGGIDVNKHFAEHHPEAVRAVFAGLSDAIVFIKHHPDRAAAIGARAYGYPKSIIVAGVRRYLQDDVWDLRTDWKAFDTVIAGMRQSGRLTHPVNIRELLDQQYLPKTDRAPTT